MLKNLSIKNYILINELNIEFPRGLITITGETGAGKSIILGALKLLLGERADIKSILNQDNKCILEGTFVLNEEIKPFFIENDLDFEIETIIRREILNSGKSRAFINDMPVTVDILQKLGKYLVDIHSQFDTQNILNENYQIKILDAFAGNKKIISEYQSFYNQYIKVSNDLNSAEDLLIQNTKDLDYKNYLLNELKEINFDKINFPQLEDKLNELNNAELIFSTLSEIEVLINQEETGVSEQVNLIENKFIKLNNLSSKFNNISEKIITLKDLIFDIKQNISKILESVENNPEELLVIQNQVDTINKLIIKHQVKNFEDLLEIRNNLINESEQFENLDEQISLLKQKKIDLENTLKEVSDDLHKKRIEKIPNFESYLIELLKKLGLENTDFKIDIQKSESFNENGTDEINFLFSANAGVALQPIKKAISGGERSRVMFAIKKIISENDNLPTLILDEIDTGISGRIANDMGEMMKELGEKLQLIAITHLPQIAAKGNTHLKVIKKESNGKSETQLIPLIREERIKEIAALLSGAEITTVALQQAIALIEK